MIVGIIPARFGSQRFPGKPLVELGEYTMIQRVYLQAKKSQKLSKVMVATDHEAIANSIKEIDGEVEMTEGHHPNGTSRCYEVASRNSADFYLNIQGDEPFISPSQIDTLCSALEENTEIATLCKELGKEGVSDPNVVKVVKDLGGDALYFSRSNIPHLRNNQSTIYYKHLGLYGFSQKALFDIVNLDPTPLEQAESLEQLRWLEHGYKIKVVETLEESISIDTPDDIKKVKHLIRG